MDIATDMEVFGPVVPIITFDTDEEAVAIANASKYGLSASVITSDMKKSFYYTEAIEASAVWVNGSSALRHNDQPFGEQRVRESETKEAVTPVRNSAA